MGNNEMQIESLLDKRGGLVKELSRMDEIKSQIAALDTVLNLFGYNGSYVRNTTALSDAGLENVDNTTPNDYNQSWSWEDKCLYTLKVLGTAFADEAAKFLFEKEEDQSEARKETVYNSVTYNMSKLKRDDKIKVVSKSGRRFRYALKD